MVQLPEDIILRLTQVLDLDSASNLARSGCYLREIGERKLWENVEVKLVNCGNDGDGDERLNQLLERLCASLIAYPARAGYIKRFRIAVTPRSTSSCETLIKVLKLVSPHIQCLDLQCPPLHSGSTGLSAAAGDGVSIFMRRLDEELRIWDKVMDLRLTGVGGEPPHILPRLLVKCPRLRTLVLRPLNNPSPPYNASLDTSDLPYLPDLRTLAIIPYLPPDPGHPLTFPPAFDKVAYKTLHQRYRSILDDLIPKAPNLERLVLDGPHPLDGIQFSALVQSLPRLRAVHLDISFPIDWTDTRRIKSGIRELSLKMRILPVTAALFMRSKRPGPLPVFPDLEILKICCPLEMARGCTFEVPLLRDDRSVLELATIAQNQPSLHTIRFYPAPSKRDHSEIDQHIVADFLEPRPRDDVEGDSELKLILRRYDRPGSQTSDRWDFCHVRSSYRTDRLEWHDVATYRRIKVPIQVLREVYEVDGDSMEWTTSDLTATFGPGGRDEVLTRQEQAAWDVLDEWWLTRNEHDTHSRSINDSKR